MQARGLFIVLEGIDRCGKTTQISKFQEFLKPSESIRYPQRESITGKIIDEYLRNSIDLPDQGIHLLFSANRWEANQRVKDILLSGVNIVCDRYAFSGIAYTVAKQMLKDKFLNYDYLQWCKSSDAGLVKPDLVIQLQITPELAKERGKYGEERYEKFQLQQNVSQVYDELSKTLEDIWVKIDASQTVEQVTSDIQKVVNQFQQKLTESNDIELKNLW